MMPTPVRGIIFDLDDTLFDCTGQLTGPARRRAANVISDIAGSDPEALCAAQAELADTLGSSGAIRALGQQYHLPESVIERALAAYNTHAVETIAPFPDVFSTLAELARRAYALSIVTSGNPDRQRQKIHLLGLTPFFDETHGALVIHDDRQTADKTPFLQQAARLMRLSCDAIMSVGDKLDAEIAASNRLGMTTVRFVHGRQKNRVPQTPDERPDFEIHALSKLLDILS